VRHLARTSPTDDHSRFRGTAVNPAARTGFASPLFDGPDFAATRFPNKTGKRARICTTARGGRAGARRAKQTSAADQRALHAGPKSAQLRPTHF